METTVIRKAIINALGASGANVKDDAASGAYRGATIICDDNTASPLVNLLPPIPKGSVIRAVKIASSAEVVQIGVIGIDVETIVASRRYKIELGSAAETYEGQVRGMFRYAYTAPAVLSGNAETDRLNVYTVLASKINAKPENKVTAYLLYKVAFTGGVTALPQIGETVTQETSGITAKIGAIQVTSGTITGTDAAGTIWLYNFSALASWSSASKTLTGGTSGFVCTTAAALTTGAGLAIVDDAGYFSARPNSKRGPSWIGATEGFTAAISEIGIATLAVGSTGELIGRSATISQGIGSRMLLDVPVFNPSKEVLVSGEADMVLNAAPDASKTYTTYILVVDEKPSDTNITGYTKGGPVNYVIWVDESNNTHLGNFNSALQSSIGVTIT